MTAVPLCRELLHRRFDVLSALLFAVLLVVVLCTFQDYGITWDERPHLQYGDYTLSFYGAILDGAPLPYHARWMSYPYGGGFDAIAAVLRQYSPLTPHDTLHLLGGIVGLLGLLGTWRLGRLLGGPATGFYAAFLLALTPVYYGHMFNNPKDTPFAVGYVWALFSICAVIRELPEVSNRLWFQLALTFGAAMFVRPVGVIVVAYLGMVLGLYCLYQAVLQRSLKAALRSFGRLGVKALAASVVAWVILVAFYPSALLRPMARPVETIEQLSYFRNFVSVMRFGSETIWSYDVPWDYLPRYFALKVPETNLVLVGLGGVFGGSWFFRRVRRGDGYGVGDLRRFLSYLTLLVALVFPPAYAMITSAALYDGLRHFLFLLPLIAVIAGSTLAMISYRLQRGYKIAFFAALAWMSFETSRSMWILHPHQYVFFNRFAGGLAEAQESYETDYYGNSHREAFKGLAQSLWASEPESFLNTIYVVDGCLSRYCAAFYIPSNMRLLKIFPEDAEQLDVADFYLADRRLFCTRFESDDPVIYRVRRLQATLSLFQDLRSETRQGSDHLLE